MEVVVPRDVGGDWLRSHPLPGRREIGCGDPGRRSRDELETGNTAEDTDGNDDHQHTRGDDAKASRAHARQVAAAM